MLPICPKINDDLNAQTMLSPKQVEELLGVLRKALLTIKENSWRFREYGCHSETFMVASVATHIVDSLLGDVFCQRVADSEVQVLRMEISELLASKPRVPAKPSLANRAKAYIVKLLNYLP